MDEQSDTHNLIDHAGLEAWLSGQLPSSDAPLEVHRMGTATGVGNALFTLRRGEQVLVLRRPPQVKNAPSANDMLREWRVITALEGTNVPHPKPRFLCEDPDVLGAPFLIMDFIDGFNPGAELEPPFDNDPSARHDLGFEIVDAIAALANVDWQAQGLQGFGKPDGYLERQVSRWLGQLASYRTRDIPELDFVASWLEQRRPEMGEPGIIHGDYSPFNVMFHHGAPARMAAIIDWDTSTIGDPVVDLGKLLSGWTGAGDEPIVEGRFSWDPTGFPSRDELTQRYAIATDRDVSHVEYFEVLGLFKLACILEGHYFQGAQGIRDAEQMETMGALVPKLIRGAARIARTSP